MKNGSQFNCPNLNVLTKLMDKTPHVNSYAKVKKFDQINWNICIGIFSTKL